MPRPKGSKNGQHAGQYICQRCGKTVHTKPSEAAKRLYCSEACFRTPRPTAICQRCGKEFTQGWGNHGAYCSRACFKNQVQKSCPQCGKAFSVSVSKSSKYQFCSVECRGKAKYAEATCQQCGKVFRVTFTRKDTARFCSRSCLYDSQHTSLNCAYCGKDFTTKRYRALGGQRCCCNRCATLLRMRDGWEPGSFGQKRQSGYRTDIETLAEKVLQALSIPYLFEYKVGRYSVDFALPTLGIALECDGWQHFTEKGRQRDQRRNAFLVEEGWTPVHIPDKLLRDDAASAISNALHINLPLPTSQS